MKYNIFVKTGNVDGAGTDANVSLTLHCSHGTVSKFALDNLANNFEKGKEDVFTIDTADVGAVQSIVIEHDDKKAGSAWYLESVTVKSQAGHISAFGCNSWLDKKNGLSRTLPFTSYTPPQNLRPIYVIAHRCNDLDKIQQALDSGANAIECDVRLNGDKTIWYVNHDIPAGAKLPDWLDRARGAAANYGDQFALIIFDIKTPEKLDTLRAQVRAYLPSDLDIVFSIPEFKDRFAFDSILGDLALNEGVAIDYHNIPSDIEAHFGARTANLWYGNGVNAGTSEDFAPNVYPSLVNAGSLRNNSGKIKKAYVWTLEKWDTIAKYINEAQVDGVMVNLNQARANPVLLPMNNAVQFVDTAFHVRRATRRDSAFRIFGHSLEPTISFTGGFGVMNEGETCQVNVTASDPDGQPVQLQVNGPHFAAATAQKSSGFVRNNTLTLSFTPSFEDGTNNYSVVVGAIGWKGVKRQASFTFTVRNVNRPPLLEPIGPLVVDENSELAKAIGASDPDRQTVQFKVEGGPGFVSLKDNGNSTGELILKPGYEDSGQYLAVVTATDPEGGRAEEAVPITVRNVNRPPVLDLIGPVSIGEGSESVKTIRAADPDKQVASLKAAGLPRFAAFGDKGKGVGELKLRPNYKDAGLYHVTITAADSEGATDKETFSIRVFNVLRPLPTEIQKHAFERDKGLIEIKFKNWLPGLALQVQRRTEAGWANVMNDTGGRAWFHETLNQNDVVRYAYGPNALGSQYRWVIYDKAEGLTDGWAVSEAFTIDEMSKNIVLTVTLPAEKN